jgi:hypothetical protein
MPDQGTKLLSRATSIRYHHASFVFAAYFGGLVLLALLYSTLTSQLVWGATLIEYAKSTGYSDPVFFATGALDIARHGWFTPDHMWLVTLWPPGFMLLEGAVLRLFGEGAPFLIPLLILSALACATWMTLLRKYLLRSGSSHTLATLGPLVPFAFPLSWFFLLSPLGLSFGETFSISFYLIGFSLVLLAFRARSIRGSLYQAALAGLAIAAAAYVRSQFELLVVVLTVSAAALFAVAGLGFLFRRKTYVSWLALAIVAVTLVVAHIAMAPWRYHNFQYTGFYSWVRTSNAVFESALRPEEELRSSGAHFVVAGGGNLACRLQPDYCGQTDSMYFYKAFFKNMRAWVAHKVQLLPMYWMAPPQRGAMVWVGAEGTLMEKLANIGFFGCLLLGLWRLWAIRREPVFPLQAWMQLSLYGCLAAVYTLVHLEARYMYLPKIFAVMALVTLLAPRAKGRPWASSPAGA